MTFSDICSWTPRPRLRKPRPRLAPPSPTSGRSRDTKSLVTRSVSRLSRGSGELARRGSRRCARVSARARAGFIWMDGTARAGPIWMDALVALFGAWGRLQASWESFTKQKPNISLRTWRASMHLGKNDPEGDGVDLRALGLGCRAPGPGRERRYLPPGTVRDVWRAFRRQYAAVACSYMHFTRIWRKGWRDCLTCRVRSQHAECTTCAHHKIVLRTLQNYASKCAQATMVSLGP